MNNDTDGNLAALAVEEKKQCDLDTKAEKEANRVDDMFKELKAGEFDPVRLIELQVIHFENNGEVDDLFRNLLIDDKTFVGSKTNDLLKLTSVVLFQDNFYRCEHVQKQMQEWAEEDLTQEAEDNRNEAECEERDNER